MCTRLRLFFFASTLGLTLAAARQSAAQTVGGVVSGIVADATGGRLAGAVVTLQHADTGASRRASTDDVGRYRLPALGPGEYRLMVEAAGFAQRAETLHLAVGQALFVDVQLHVAGGHEEVRVVASAVQRESAELGGVIERRQILELPVNGRSFEQLALLEPGVVATTSRESSVLYQHGLKININGAGSRSNAFFLDGTSVTDLYNNGLGSVAGTFLGLEAVREFQVLTNSYTAAYGGAGGGVVSIVTKSGTHDPHGSAFALLRDDGLDARNYFDVAKPDFSRRQVGFSLGGPAIPDRLFYFTTGEWLRETLGLTQVTTVPSLAARRGELPDPQNPGRPIAVNPAVQPYLDLFPLPSGRDFGDGLAEHTFAATRRTRDSFGQVRLDARLGGGHTVFARLTVDGARKAEPARYPGLGVEWDSKSRYLTVEDAHVLSAAAVNTWRFSYSFTDLAQTDTTGRTVSPDLSILPGRPLPHLVIGGMPAFGSLVSPFTHARQRLFAWSDDIAISKGRHLIKAGALVEHFRALVDFQFFWGGRYSFPDVRRFLQGRPSVLSVALPGSESERELFTTQLGMYVQDDVKLWPRLTLNAGVRWEFSTAPRETRDRLVALKDPLHDTEVTLGMLLRTEKGNVAPRVGLAWTPSGDGRTVLRGGAGVFYDINTLPYITQTVGTNPPYFRQVTVTSPGFPRPELRSDTVLSLSIPRFDWRTPRFYHYNAAFERELPGRTVVTVAYAGSRGRFVVRSGDINAPVSAPDGTRFFAAGAARRNPSFGAIAYRTPDGDSWYNALQVKMTRRSRSGLQVHAGYTLSRAVDQTQGTLPTEALGSVTQWMDPDERNTDRGPADFDRKHNLSLSLIWGSPSFQSAAPPVRAVLAGWTVSSIISLRSGNPFTVGVQADYSRTLARVSVHRPNLRPEFTPEQIILGRPDQYFNPRAFELQAPGTFGNVGRNSLVGPGVATVDLALTKAVRARWLGPSGGLQVRVEAFNLLNRANFSLPQRIVFAGVRPDEAPLGTAGRITSTTTSAREIQIGLKVLW